MMPFHLFSDLKKHSKLKLQINQDFQFFSFGIDVWYNNFLVF